MKSSLFKLFLKITLASFLTLFLYVFFAAVLIAPIAAIPIVWVANLVLSLFLSFVFSLILYNLQYKKNQIGEKLFWDDFPDGTPYNIRDDIKKIAEREKTTIVLFCSIIMGVWALIAFDNLALGQRMISAIGVIYGPMYLFASLFPSWLFGIMGYAVSCFASSAVYIAVQVLLHKKWYKEYKG